MSDASPGNPYATPAVQPARRNRDRRLLEFYWQYRDGPPSLLRLLLKQFPGWCLIAVFVVTSSIVMAVLVGVTAGIFFGAFMLGMLCGAVARDLGVSWRFIQSWPLIQQILHWDMIERLLEK